jgi:hypothetical protein
MIKLPGSFEVAAVALGLCVVSGCGAGPDGTGTEPLGTQQQAVTSDGGVGSPLPPPSPTPLHPPPPGTPPPKPYGTGEVAGIPVAGGSLYYCADALISGWDWFAQLNGWFPSVHHTSYSVNPAHEVIDMAYATEGRMTFKDVVVPTTGTYTLTIRYAFASGLFGGIDDRPMGIAVNGIIVDPLMHFPITNSFSVYSTSAIKINLPAGKNEITIYNLNDHGVSRVDTMTITH